VTRLLHSPASSFIAYGAFAAAYLFPGTTVPWLLDFCLSLLGARSRSQRMTRLAGRHSTFAWPWNPQSYEPSCSRLAFLFPRILLQCAPWGLVALGLQEVHTIVFVFPAFFCSVHLGHGCYWPPISDYHRFCFPRVLLQCAYGARLLLASNEVLIHCTFRVSFSF
jgi:hypothetical protein